MLKKFLMLTTLVMFLWAGVLPVSAAAIGNVYVDTAYTGSEDGTEQHPYNTLQEGIAFAQAQTGGAWLYIKQSNGQWLKFQYVPPSIPGATGVPITDTVQYALLAALALGLLFIGWQFQRRARQAAG